MLSFLPFQFRGILFLLPLFRVSCCVYIALCLSSISCTFFFSSLHPSTVNRKDSFFCCSFLHHVLVAFFKSWHERKMSILHASSLFLHCSSTRWALKFPLLTVHSGKQLQCSKQEAQSIYLFLYRSRFVSSFSVPRCLCVKNRI